MRLDATTRAVLPEREVTDLHLLRHGEVETGGRRLAYGHADLPLTARGAALNDALARLCQQRLPRPDGVLTSDLQRCEGLARGVATALGVPLVSTPALREQHMGAWEGRAWEDLTREDLPGVRRYWERYHDRAPPGGESLVDLAERVRAWRAGAGIGGGRWVVVTHVGVIRALLCDAMGTPLDQALRWAPPRGSHTHLIEAAAGAVLTALGERPEAPPDPLDGPLTVALSGSAGVGKSTLGTALADALDLPFIDEGMRRRLERGLNLHSLGHDELADLIEALWVEQVEAEDAAVAAHGGFVSDRSAADFAAFWLHYHFTGDRGRTDAFMARTLGHARRYARVVLLPWGVLPLVDDGVRSTNPWLQRHMHATVHGLLREEVAPERLLVLPAMQALEARLAWVLTRLPAR